MDKSGCAVVGSLFLHSGWLSCCLLTLPSCPIDVTAFWKRGENIAKESLSLKVSLVDVFDDCQEMRGEGMGRALPRAQQPAWISSGKTKWN
jgi:hypothetical protein